MHRPHSFSRGIVGVAGLLAACAATAQTTYKVIDTESLERRTVDALVTCPLGYASIVSGGNEGCPTGRAPATGECGLSFDCSAPPSVADAVRTADHWWAHLFLQPMVLDLVQPSGSVFVFNAADHGPFPEESVEWTVWGGDTTDTSNFPTGWSLGDLVAIYKQGWVESGACPGDDSDDYTGLYEFDRPYRYILVYANFSITIFTDAAHTTWMTMGDSDPVAPGWQSNEAELDAIARPLDPPPVVNAGPDRTFCLGAIIPLEAMATPAPIYSYDWDTNGDRVPDTRGSMITVQPAVPGIYTYTVYALGACGRTSDDLTIEIIDCPLAVIFDQFGARLVDDDITRRAVIEWTTASEDGTLGFWVERAATNDSTFVIVGDFIDAHGPEATYRVIDDTPLDGARYRIVEFTDHGAGDQSPEFTAKLGGAKPTTGERQR